MRRFWAFLILLILSLPISLKIVWITDWIINNEVAQENCINKENAEMHCNGSCQLDKKMSQLEVTESDKNTENIFQYKLYISDFVLYTCNLFSIIHIFKDILVYNIFNVFYEFQYFKIYLKPPTA